MNHRDSIRVRGLIQGVGFRPHVYRVASSLGLGGFVTNVTDHVLIEIEGEPRRLDQFRMRVMSGLPPMARIEHMEFEREVSLENPHVAPFRIQANSQGPRGSVGFGSDVATCDECVQELFSAGNRRFRYPFITCVDCGPRWTIISDAPYGRESSAMAAFAMCLQCQGEFDDPTDRRFHAESMSCPNCGPQLRYEGRSTCSIDPVQQAAADLRCGRIGAIKGIGGYHLACDAASSVAVAELRRRKGRDDRPLAVMVADESAAEQLCELNAEEVALLKSAAHPIVLLLRRPGVGVAAEVSNGTSTLGVMLAYAPVHHLLLRESGSTALVMTSGNRSGEPITYEDQPAHDELASVADFLLWHNRPIVTRCDDSVTRIVDGAELILRRSRGHVPESMVLPRPCSAPVLAVGGHQKVTVGLGIDDRAVLSHHLGDLDSFAAYQSFEYAIDHLESIFGVVPRLIVHDLHPGYATTQYAIQRNVETLAVQHHHAHVASCMAEHGLDGTVIGVAFDGTGLGTDDQIWGGEFLVASYDEFRRAGYLRYVPMPGADQAIKEPWRMALAYLRDAGEDPDLISGDISSRDWILVNRLLDRGPSGRFTSSMGRLFDSVAVMAGLHKVVTHEGQAAIELERQSEFVACDHGYPFEISRHSADRPFTIDCRPMIREVVSDVQRGVDAGRIGRRFHSSVVELIASGCRELRSNLGTNVVVLSGGVFMNRLLLHETVKLLRHEEFEVYRHCRVPPNDGGLSLGQLAIASAWLNRGSR